MSNSGLSRLLEDRNGIRNRVSTAFNEIADKEESRSVETVVTMYSNQGPWCVFGKVFEDVVDDFDELADFCESWWDLGNGGEFVVFDWAEGGGFVGGLSV